MVDWGAVSLVVDRKGRNPKEKGTSILFFKQKTGGWRSGSRMLTVHGLQPVEARLEFAQWILRKIKEHKEIEEKENGR